MFLFSPLTAFSAEKEDSFLSGFLTKFEMFRNVTGQLYTITTDVTSVIVSRKYSGISRIGINSENIYLLSGKFVLLPDGLNISLGYSTTTTGLLGSKSEEGKGSSSRESEYVETAFDVLKTVDMISSDMSWSSAGMCGKKQIIPVGMGGPAIKCKVNIGGR